jgi:SWI/SNF-related matrix-associated actin-dependent regulator of chromatin subfamily A member 5
MTDNKDDDEDIEEDDSDIELDGVDMEDDGDVAMAEDDISPVARAAPVADEEDEENTELAAKETAELEAARKERLELLKAEKEALKSKVPPPTDTQSRLEYLLHQSDVFAHFLAGSVAVTSKKKRASKSKGRSQQGGRLTEEEEDELLLKSAQSERHAVVRLDHQPSILAPVCKMHPYQLDGLNWMIKLHDHGINAILADGTLNMALRFIEK